MSVTQLISDYSDAPDLCWFIAGSAHNRNALFDSQSIATSTSAPTMQLVTSPLRSHQRLPTNYLPLPLRADPPPPLAAVKSHSAPAARPAHYLPPRFRALALFSRRPSQRVVRS
jgi:hypothetical protein